jgi:3'(2'), 5'-bisphosphate nucleotidase
MSTGAFEGPTLRGMFDPATALEKMLAAAWKATTVIQKIYGEPDFGVEMKAKNDPVTRADKQANAILIRELSRSFRGVPIVAEESDPDTYADYRSSEAAFFVDPLDGTREFVAKNGEFCVMLGLAIGGQARLGVIVVPTEERAYIGSADSFGSFRVTKNGRKIRMHVGKKRSLKDATCIVSRSHQSPETDAILKSLGTRSLIRYGSAGRKALKVATDEVDLYCHPGPSGCRWDSCAPEAIVLGAGGVMTTAKGKAFGYRGRSLKNTSGVLAGNPELHAKALAKLLRAG